MLDLAGPWGWSNFAVDHADTLHEKCANWETMRDVEVFGSGGNKRIPAERLCQEAQDRLTALELDDHGALWELRLAGKPRVWGLRSGYVFYPVWWDPEHTVCPSKLRHT